MGSNDLKNDSYAVALCNLCGLGIGYLLLGQRKRWLFYFMGLVILIATAQLTNASENSLIWALVFIVYFLWMSIDAWMLSRKTQWEYPGILKNSKIKLLFLAIALNAVVIGAFLFYRVSGENYYQYALQRFNDSDYYSAFNCFDRVTKYYRVSLNPSLIDSAEKKKECSLLIYGQNVSNEGNYEDAIVAFDTHNTSYPNSIKVEEANLLSIQIYRDWARSLKAESLFQEGLETLNTILARYPEESSTLKEEIDEDFALHFLDWAQYLYESESYQESIDKYHEILTNYSHTQSNDQAYEGIAQAYYSWAQVFRESDQYETAVGRYRKIISSYGSSSLVSKAKAQIPETYIEWGIYLRNNKHFLLSMDKFQEVKEQTKNSSLISRAENEYENTIPLLARDSGSDGKLLLDQARGKAYNGEGEFHLAIDYFKEEPGKALVCGSQVSLRDSLQAKAPGYFRYIILREDDSYCVESCPYTGGYTLKRMRHTTEITVKDVLTGEKVSTKKFYGSYPDYCPFQRIFSWKVEKTYGLGVSKDEINDWLEKVIQ